MINALKFLLRPLTSFLESGSERREEVYQYLYFKRSGVEKDVESAILKGNHNITIVGKAGSGKTSMMHYMFIEFKKHHNENTYPIILDYRNIIPKKAETLLIDFVEKARDYFNDIKIPINKIVGETNFDNCNNHSRLIQAHLAEIPNSMLKKRMIIFLDDLDYADKDYMKILQDFFLPYAASDKTILVLSVRPPLLNTIKLYDPLKQFFHIYPREIKIPDDDLEEIFTNRLKTMMDATDKIYDEMNFVERNLFKFLRTKNIDDMLIEKIRENDPEFESKNFSLPFKDVFYSQLRNITYSNFRFVEELLPEFISWELEHPENNLSDNFYENFILLTRTKNHILLDLVTEKTRTSGKRTNGNAILQNVLEYFYFEEVAEGFFYEKMSQFGISNTEADFAIDKLINTPYSLIEPEFVNYELESRVRKTLSRYEINIKGIQYVENILRMDSYYSEFPNELGKKYIKSNRSYYDEHSKMGNRISRN